MLLVLCLLFQGCAHHAVPSLVVVQERDLIQQAREGEGERLAKPVPGRPILVNNQLVFSAPGDAVLGIAMAVGAIQRTVEALSDMGKVDLIGIVASAEVPSSEQIKAIEPYCYLNGYPHAVLESRLHLVSSHGSSMKVLQSQRLPVLGESSWSWNRGEQLVKACTQGISQLVEELKPGRGLD